ncbi:hypothetical protein B0H11DRAFT_2122494 [Mycena galericulata]|nr:hypothetical protein B0H11DRAFT_2122494 [Mycena galericulata]
MLREHPTPLPHLDIPPFRPRKQPPSTTRHFNHRAALFYGIHSRLPSYASRAACARYRLGRKTAAVAPVAPDTAIHLARLRTRLADLQELLHHLTFLRPLPPSSPMSSTSPIGHPAPVVSQHLRTTRISLPETSSSISTPLQGPSEASNGASRPFVDFGGFFGG